MKASIPDQIKCELSHDGHPAVEAWSLLDSGNIKPRKISSLFAAKLANNKNKDKRKSAVYKLEGAGRTGASIVAKMCNPKTAVLERTIYEQILPHLPISSLKYYGHVEDELSHWLFLEYAGGVEWRIDDRTHIELAVKWLADMHGSTMHLDTLSLLPYRGPSYYLSQLTVARKRMVENISNPALAPADIGILNSFITCSSILETHWQHIDAFCETMPESLVHNDFVSKNIHVRGTDSAPILLAFDWEMSGRGVPADDLFWMFQHAPAGTITRYWERLRNFRRNIALQDIECLVIFGMIFRISDAVEWASRYLLTDHPTRKIHHTNLYAERLNHAFRILGWS